MLTIGVLLMVGAILFALAMWAIGDARNDRELNEWRNRALLAEKQADQGIARGQDLQRAIRELRRACWQLQLEADLARGVAKARKRLDGDEPSRAPDALVAMTVPAPFCVFDMPVYDEAMAHTYVREVAQN